VDPAALSLQPLGVCNLSEDLSGGERHQENLLIDLLDMSGVDRKRDGR
jgi:hypothetical protein